MTKVSPKSGSNFSQVLSTLKKMYPDAHCALNFENPFELLIATALSAQCTDIRVNLVTKVLFKCYPTPLSLSKAKLKDIEEIIHSTGFYKNKAKNIQECARILVEKYNQKVPSQLEDLVGLPGVGRKTANVVLGNAFGIANGVVVDTHVMRLSRRLGWTTEEDPVKIEQKLNKLCPKDDWIMLSHYLISHGRSICKARAPDCKVCQLQTCCPRKYL